MTIIFVLVLILFRTGCSEEIITFPENKTATLGSLVEFQCGVKFSATVSALTWEFNGEAVYHYQFDREEYPSNSKIANKFVVRQDGTNFKLTLKNAFFDAAGNYTCRLTRVFATVHLVVIDTPRLIAFVPKNDKENMALYVCEAKFAGPSKTELAPHQYPQLKMFFDYVPIEEPFCELQPKNSSSYRVLKQTYDISLQPNMDGKQLKCMIMTSSSEVASTEIEVRSHGSEGEQLQAAASNSSTNAAVAFSVINCIILLVIMAIIFKIYILKKVYNKVPQEDPEQELDTRQQDYKTEEVEKHQNLIELLNENIQALQKFKEADRFNTATFNSKDQKPSNPPSASPDSLLLTSDEQSSQLMSQDQEMKPEVTGKSEQDPTAKAENTPKHGKSEKKKGLTLLFRKSQEEKSGASLDKEAKKAEEKAKKAEEKAKKAEEKAKKAEEKAKKAEEKAKEVKSRGENDENIRQSQEPTPGKDTKMANAPVTTKNPQESEIVLVSEESSDV